MTWEVLERGIVMRDRLGTKAAGEWFQKQGISRELGIIALVGSEKARKHGINTSRICRPGWRMAEPPDDSDGSETGS